MMIEESRVVELIPLPDEAGAAETLGHRWGWHLVSLPTLSVLDFGPVGMESREEAEQTAAYSYPDLEIVQWQLT